MWIFYLPSFARYREQNLKDLSNIIERFDDIYVYIIYM